MAHFEESDLVEARRRKLFSDGLERASLNSIQEDEHVVCAAPESNLAVACGIDKLVWPHELLAKYDFMRNEYCASGDLRGLVLQHSLLN